MPHTPPSRLHRWIIAPIRDQLTRGVTPEKLSWTIALGVTLGIFPIMGSTSLVCFIAGYFLKLNQAILHLFKSLTYPLHLALILVFIRLGQYMNGVPPIPFSIPQMLVQFKESPARFARDFGMAALYGIEAWAIAALILIPLIRIVSLPLLKKLIPSKNGAVGAPPPVAKD
ncbi:DUF2062 domain-containing protein [Akkermansiaceae bacterium]|nr:DUF2062 domain-containing protein [Akkermansiaceae bacterium]